jgi:hypothetical protein
MVDDAVASDARLPELLAARAHAASTRRLRADVIGGCLAAGAALAWQPPAWIVLLAAALCFATFGGWGLIDRAIGARSMLDRGAATRSLKLTRTALAVLGTVAAATMGFGVLVLVLGTWIS